MAVYRVSAEGVEIVITDDLDERMRAIFETMVRAASAEVIDAFEPVATRARAEWYGPNGVKRRTGASGDVIVTAAIATDLSSVTVAVGSTDTKIVKGANGRARPRATAIHRPGVFARERVELTKDEYFRRWRLNKEGKQKSTVWQDKKTGKYYGYAPAQNAGDGAYLLPKLVNVPARAALKAINIKIGRRIASAIRTV